MTRFRHLLTGAIRLTRTSPLTPIVALFVFATAAFAAPPAIYNLGALGGSSSVGYAVNDAGQVAGTSDNRAFRYDGTPGSGGVMRDLGTLGVNSSARAWGINNAGQVAGDSGIHAFRYDGTPGSGGVMRQLDTFVDETYGFSVNNAGQVAGAIYTSNYHAFRYDGTPGSGGVMRDLGTLGGSGSIGYGINDAGQVAGQSSNSGNTAAHAFRYDGTPGSGGVMRDLGTLGGSDSEGRAVNNAGQVAGSSHITGSTARHAFRYDGTPGAGGIMRDLGTLGGIESNGWGVNNAGQVVGDSGIHAFLYTGTPGAGGQMIDLDTWLDANNPTEGAKWTLSSAYDISDTGWITGAGSYDPDGPGGIAAGQRAYLLDASSLIVPEPPGDFNRDGTVDAADYVLWRKNPSAFGGDPTGYDTWRANFGHAAGSGAALPSAEPLSAAVPEPSSLALFTVAAPALLRRRRARRAALAFGQRINLQLTMGGQPCRSIQFSGGCN